jgi:hypothetical protein
MTVSSTSCRVVYLGNGSTTSFPFAFKVLAASDLTVLYTDANGNITTLTSGQYTVVGAFPTPNTGGSVTYNPNGTPIAAGTTLTIYRNEDATQPSSISNQGASWPSVIEQALDRVTLLVQQFIDKVNRSLRVGPNDGTTLNELPAAAQRANSVLGFDASGQPVAVQGITSAPVSTWLATNFLPMASRTAALGALGGAGTADNNGFTGTNSFSQSPTVPTPAMADNSTKVADTAFVAGALGGTALRSYLAGVTLSNNATTPNSKIDVAAGVCSDSTNSQMLAVAAGTIDCGTTGANGLDAGTLANSTWYHAFVIGKTDGTTALLASTSVSSPTMPTGYTLKRRIGSFKTDGSAHLLAFKQKGDRFLWALPSVDLNQSNVNFPTVLTALTLNVPTGVQVDALFVPKLGNAGVLYIGFFSPDLSSSITVPNSANANVIASANFGVAYLAVRTNTSGQVNWIASGGGTSQTAVISTEGWIDSRGRDS